MLDIEEALDTLTGGAGALKGDWLGVLFLVWDRVLLLFNLIFAKIF